MAIFQGQKTGDLRENNGTIVLLFFWNQYLFFMASSLCHSLVQHTIIELLSKRIN